MVLRLKKGTVLSTIAFLATALVLGPGVFTEVWAATGTAFAEVHRSDLSDPNVGELTYIVYNNGDLTSIVTEDNYNAGTGPDQGYGSGFWIVNWDNFQTPPNFSSTDPTAIEFYDRGSSEGGTFSGSVPTGFEGPFSTTNLSAASNAYYPVGASTTNLPSQILLSWTNQVGQSYAVYRSAIDGDIGLGTSNGHYFRVATNVTSPYLDGPLTPGQKYWYLLVPMNGPNRGGHSEEVSGVPQAGPTETPTPTETPAVTPTPTATPGPPATPLTGGPGNALLVIAFSLLLLLGMGMTRLVPVRIDD